MTVTVIQNGDPVIIPDVSFVEIKSKDSMTFEAVAEGDVQIWKTEEEA